MLKAFITSVLTKFSSSTAHRYHPALIKTRCI